MKPFKARSLLSTVAKRVVFNCSFFFSEKLIIIYRNIEKLKNGSCGKDKGI